MSKSFEILILTRIPKVNKNLHLKRCLASDGAAMLLKMSICRNVGKAAFEFAAVSNMEIYISVIVVRRNCYVNERITNDIFPEFLPLSFLYHAKEKLDYWGK